MRGKKNRFQMKITIGLFVALIFGPSIIWMIWGGVIGDDSNENRKLAEMPEFGLEESLIEKYPKEFDKYYNDHAPFRTFFRNIWTRANYVLWADSVDSKVVVGKMDNNNPKGAWLFYDGEGDASPIRGVQGGSSYSEQQIENAIKILKENTEQMAKEGRRFYFFVAPNKENIYREYLPDNIEIFDEKSKNEKMIEAMQNSADNVIYVKTDLINAKKYGKLYSRQDTHWNSLGAFYGFKALMKAIEPSFNVFEHEVVIPKPYSSGEDLAKFLGMTDYFLDDNPVVEYLNDAKLSTETHIEGERQLDVWTNGTSLIDKTVMVMGDSYRLGLVPHLKKVFKRTISASRGDQARSIIDEYDPDVVISEAVERGLLAGVDFKI